MPASLSNTKRSGASALLIGLGDATARAVEAHIHPRGLDAHRVDALDGRSSIHTRSTAVIVARADTLAALTELCEASLDVPVIGVLDDLEGEADALRAGCVAVLGSAPAEEVVRLALDRALGVRESPPSGEEPTPPSPPRRRLLGDSQAMRRVIDLVARTALVPATALVRGETGTGKELVARALHEESARKSGPFVTVHCGALPDTLLESELFGYEKGAFTGASSRKPGRVELANGGTLFLDEIGDVSAAAQVKLLRLLQDKEYERLGGVTSLRADVRFVAATHRNLEAMVKKGEFREDLFYRLNVVNLWLPPLRARRDDIPLLAKQFCADFAKTYGKSVALDGSALEALRAERWPGNVRQLQNFVERLVVLSLSEALSAEDVRNEMADQVQFKTQMTARGSHAALEGGRGPGVDSAHDSVAGPLDDALRVAEKKALDRALRQANGNRTVAARVLGISRGTLYTKMAEHGLT
jgi:two-component system, NtrC family, response regulator AtoC